MENWNLKDGININQNQNRSLKKVKLATVVEGDPKATFSVATTLSYRGGRFFFLWIAPLYLWYVLYNAEC